MDKIETKTPNTTFTFTAEQAKVISEACDLYARLKIGQVHALSSYLYEIEGLTNKQINDDLKHNRPDLAKEKRDHFTNFSNSISRYNGTFYSILSSEVDKKAKIAYVVSKIANGTADDFTFKILDKS